MEATTFCRAPLDGEGFVQSFSLADAEGQRAFFEIYGFVVVRDVLDPDEVEVTPPT